MFHVVLPVLYLTRETHFSYWYSPVARQKSASPNRWTTPHGAGHLWKEPRGARDYQESSRTLGSRVRQCERRPREGRTASRHAPAATRARCGETGAPRPERRVRRGTWLPHCKRRSRSTLESQASRRWAARARRRPARGTSRRAGSSRPW